MIDPIGNFFRNESGAPSVEYALLLAFIALVIVTSVGTLGTAVKGAFENATTKFTGGS